MPACASIIAIIIVSISLNLLELFMNDDFCDNRNGKTTRTAKKREGVGP
jgi:hypothetical protein